MKILITGANGGIGKKLLDKIITRKGYDLFILSRKTNHIDKKKSFSIQTGNLLDYESLKKATKNIDTVIHLAGLTHTNKEEDYYKINLDGTINLLKASEANSVKKFIFISSRAASLNGGAYAKSKYLAQEQVAKYKYNWIILSPAEVFGTDSDEAIAKIIELIKKYPVIPVPGNGNYKLCPVFVEDVVDAIIQSIETSCLNKNYLIAGPEAYSYKEFIDFIAKMYGKKVIKLYIPLKVLKIASVLLKKRFTKDQIARLATEKPEDISLAKSELGFNPRHLVEGLKIN